MSRIYLIGYRGCGKSTVGPLLAARLGWAFVDADAELEARAGRTIAAIFRTDGEPAFRELEAGVLRDLAARERLVVGTGGGAILREANREVLRATGFAVWLHAPAELLFARMQSDASSHSRRPNLTAGGGFAEVQSLLAVREPLYRAASHSTIDGSLSPDRATAAILDAWNGLCSAAGSSSSSSSA